MGNNKSQSHYHKTQEYLEHNLNFNTKLEIHSVLQYFKGKHKRH